MNLPPTICEFEFIVIYETVSLWTKKNKIAITNITKYINSTHPTLPPTIILQDVE